VAKTFIGRDTLLADFIRRVKFESPADQLLFFEKIFLIQNAILEVWEKEHGHNQV